MIKINFIQAQQTVVSL